MDTGGIFGKREFVGGLNGRASLKSIVVPVEQGTHNRACRGSLGAQEIGNLGTVGKSVDNGSVAKIGDRADLTK
jgi:hypothetical protein